MLWYTRYTRQRRVISHLWSKGEGMVTYEDFIDGVLRCKGPARAIDQTFASRMMNFSMWWYVTIVTRLHTCFSKLLLYQIGCQGRRKPGCLLERNYRGYCVQCLSCPVAKDLFAMRCQERGRLPEASWQTMSTRVVGISKQLRFALPLFIQRSALCYLNSLLLHRHLPVHQVIGVILGGEQGHPGKASPREKEEGPQRGPTAAWQSYSDFFILCGQHSTLIISFLRTQARR